MVKNTETTTSSPSDRADFKFKGVRKRKWGKYVSEIRLPNSRERIWLGSYDSAQKAARAFDAALFCLRGRNAKFNFPDTPPDIAGARLLSPAEIQAAASRFANSAASSVSTSLSDPVPSHSDSSPSPSPSEGTEGDVSLDALDNDNSIWDLNHYHYSYNNNNNYGYSSYDDNINGNMDPGQYSGSVYYPNELGLYTDLDALPTDLEDNNYDDTSLNHGSFLWNF